MDSFEWNKIFMGLGFSILTLFGISELTKALFHTEKPSTSGYVVEGVETAGETGGNDGAPVAEAVLPDFGTVLAAADIEAGKKAAQKCTQCHTWDKGGANKIGPNLYGIMGAKHAQVAGFNYSAAMKALADKPWDYAEMYKFLERPAGYIKGTKMAFAGIRNSEDRIALLAYMRTWADTPFPIPAAAPVAPAAPAEGAAPAVPAEGTAPSAPAEGAPAPEAPAAPAAEAPATEAPATGAEPAAPAATEPAAPEAPAAEAPAAEAPAIKPTKGGQPVTEGAPEPAAPPVPAPAPAPN